MATLTVKQSSDLRGAFVPTEAQAGFATATQGAKADVAFSWGNHASAGYATQLWVTAKGYATEAWVTAKGYATQAWVTAQNFATQTWVVTQGFLTSVPAATKETIVGDGGGAYTLAATPAGAIQLFYENVAGVLPPLLLEEGAGYTIAGANITMVAPAVVPATDKLHAYYMA